MPSTTVLALAAIVVAPAIVSATTFNYFSSVFCDAQSPQFRIESYTPSLSMKDDQTCNQTPASTMGIQLAGGLDSECVVLAYEDSRCSDMIGSIPASGKCVASTTARIGSWQASCNTTAASNSHSTISTSIEFKRRGRTRGPVIRAEANLTSICTTITKTVSSAGNKTSSASSTISAGGYNLTSSTTDRRALQSTTAAPGFVGAGNGTQGNFSYTAPSVTTTATYVGKSGGNGTIVLHVGNVAARNLHVPTLVFKGLVTVMGAFFAL